MDHHFQVGGVYVSVLVFGVIVLQGDHVYIANVELLGPPCIFWLPEEAGKTQYSISCLVDREGLPPFKKKHWMKVISF